MVCQKNTGNFSFCILNCAHDEHKTDNYYKIIWPCALAMARARMRPFFIVIANNGVKNGISKDRTKGRFSKNGT